MESEVDRLIKLDDTTVINKLIDILTRLLVDT